MQGVPDKIIGSLIVGIIAGVAAISTILYPLPGFLLFLVSIPVFILLGSRYFNRFFLWLMLYMFVYISIAATIVSREFLISNGQIANADIVPTSVLIGVVIAFLITVALFFTLVAAIAVGWYKDEGMKFPDLFNYLIRSALGLPTFSVEIVGGEKRGKAKDLERLEQFGGPGKMRIYPGDIVVTHKHGDIKRAVGSGVTFLKSKEKINTIIPLGGKGAPHKIENAMTRDRIPLDINIFHKATIEPAEATRARLAEAESADEPNQSLINNLRAITKTPEIGMDGTTCYEGIAKNIAGFTPDPWANTKSAMDPAIIDIIATIDCEDLFNCDGNTVDFDSDVSQRLIGKIEKHVAKKVKDSKIRDGIILNFIDIGTIKFPEGLSDKVQEEIAALVDVRIRKTNVEADVEEAKAKARIKKLETDAEKAAILTQADAELSAAKIRANAELIKGVNESRIKASRFHYAIKALKDAGRSDKEIQAVLEKLASAAVIEDELREIIKLSDIKPGSQIHLSPQFHNGTPVAIGNDKNG